MQHGGPFTFITGRAGTGKSTLLNHFREQTKLIAPVLAPTGIAAINVQGETIHRFFHFVPGITANEAYRKGCISIKNKIYQKADILIIDEISMVRADLLDCIDNFMRGVRRNKRPFGGLRIVVIGDLYQLPPILTTQEKKAFLQMYETPYFFSSHVVKRLIATGDITCIELEKVYRQSDISFISLLNAVRDQSISEKKLKLLNQRLHAKTPEQTIILTTINVSAEKINLQHLNQLSGRTFFFESTSHGVCSDIEMPTECTMKLKIGARVMCIANDPQGRFVNGSLGLVIACTMEPTPLVTVKLDNGILINVTNHTWNMYRSTFNEETKTLDQEKIGSFTQIPLKLAWAITIHKSQGKTFDHVTIDLGNGAFTSGQTYVALSRCRSFEGISLMQPVYLSDIKLNPSIIQFLSSLKEPDSETELNEIQKKDLLHKMIESKQRLKIIYLTSKNEKTERIILPSKIKKNISGTVPYLVVYAFCELRQSERSFRLDHILHIQNA
ncbi:AAA family ATPase [Candidatus Uhrbacteria bacterium]|nr:AAA family ATPase [Candidatus Uhrbacteria bacterium]